MSSLKTRLDKIENEINAGAESFILVKFPEKPGFTHGDRTFPSVEDAVETLERELGYRITPTVLEVVYVEAKDGRAVEKGGASNECEADA